MTEIKLLRTHPSPPMVAQSGVRRDWMDSTYAKHAYQCYPLTMANVMGWEVRLENDVVAVWDGGNSVPRIVSGEKSAEGRQICSASIIGQLSFHIGYVFKTEESYGTMISGSPNFDYNGAIPLTAYIPSDWWPDEVFMNWRIEEVGKEVVFKKDSPFMFFTILDTSLVTEASMSFGDYWGEISQEQIDSRTKYGEMKSKLQSDNPWKSWAKGIKSGVDADGQILHEPFIGLPRITVPEQL